MQLSWSTDGENSRVWVIKAVDFFLHVRRNIKAQLADYRILLSASDRIQRMSVVYLLKVMMMIFKHKVEQLVDSWQTTRN